MLLAVVILTGSFYNLANYPTIGWDEAIFSETAANLVQHGRYAFTVQSPNQLNDLDYRISAGPAVILPVALASNLAACRGPGPPGGRTLPGVGLPGPVSGPGASGAPGPPCWPWPWPCWAPTSSTGAAPSWEISRPWRSFCWAPGFSSRDWKAVHLPLFLGGLCLGLAFDAKEFYGLAFLPPLGLLVRRAWREPRRLGLALLAYGSGLALPLLAYLLLKAIILGSLVEAVFHFLRQKKLLCQSSSPP